MAKKKKTSDNLGARLTLVIKSGKYSLGYKSTIKTLRSGKCKLVLIGTLFSLLWLARSNVSVSVRPVVALRADCLSRTLRSCEGGVCCNATCWTIEPLYAALYDWRQALGRTASTSLFCFLHVFFFHVMLGRMPVATKVVSHNWSL